MYQINNILINNIYTTLLSYKSDRDIELHHTLNVNHFVQSVKYPILKNIINDKDSVVSVDGFWIILSLIFNYKLKKVSIIKNSGSDLILPIIHNHVKSSEAVLLLGSTIENNQKAVSNAILKFGNNNIFGYSPPFKNVENINDINPNVFKLLKEYNIKVIITAFGVPKQEIWAFKNKQKLIDYGVKKVYFFGGAIDFLSGELSRSPRFIQNIGLESVYRLLKQPKRLPLFISWVKYLPKLFPLTLKKK